MQSTTNDTPSRLSQATRLQAIIEGTGCSRPVCSQCRIRERDLPTISSSSGSAAGKDEGATAATTAATATTVTPPKQKMLRCSRCKVAHYCSPQCQKRHFSFHKQPCKYIFQQLQHLNELQLQTAIQAESSSPSPTSDTTVTAMATVLTNLGDHLVETGYRETDTIENGSSYYRQALHYYCQVLERATTSAPQSTTQTQTHPDNNNNALEDKILLLLAILGADPGTIHEWYQYSGSPRLAYYENDDDGDGPVDDTCFHMINLLVGMHSLLEYRTTLKAFETYHNATKVQDHNKGTANLPQQQQQQQSEAVHDRILSFLVDTHTTTSNNPSQSETQTLLERNETALSTEIRKTIQALRQHGKGHYLMRLRDHIPFQPAYAPDLLRCAPIPAGLLSSSGVVTSMAPDDVHDDGEMASKSRTTPREFWFLYQDCFFLTPGLNDVLHEFLPEEEDEDDDSDNDREP